MDMSWSELLVVGVVALIVIGPKDLPGMFRELGRFTAKLRAMGREFSNAMEQAAKESGVKDAADDLKKATSPKALGLDAVKSAADRFEKWDPLKNAAKPTGPTRTTTLTPPPMPAMPPAAASAAEAPAAAPEPAPVGPHTAALMENQAARKAASAEATAKRKAEAAAKKAAAEPVAAAEEAAPTTKRSAGRVRKKAGEAAGETA